MTARPVQPRPAAERRAAHNAAALHPKAPATRTEVAALAATITIGCAVWVYLLWRAALALADRIGWPLTGTTATALAFVTLALAVRAYRRSTHR